MDEQRTFVGRKAELDRFLKILEDPRGQAVMVVGQAGMGKTWLLDRMAYLATQHPSLKCGWVRYEVTPTDSPDSTMALMMDNAFEAAKKDDGFFELTDRSRSQWATLFRVLIPKGGEILDLRDSLRRDPQKHTREQFLDRLHLISKRMGPDGRAFFVIAPDKLMCRGCSDSWRLVMRDLPDKIKFLFAQRPEDELINSNNFMALANVIRLPDAPLGVLSPEDVEELVRLRADEIGQSGRTLRDAMTRYQGHPYAIQAAMEIVKTTKSVEDLPQDPTPEKIAAAQWQQVCRTGEDAIRLFEAYAILEVAVPHDIVQTVSGLGAPAMKRLLGDPYLRGLLRDEGEDRRIYHAILADHVRSQIAPPEQQALHMSAVRVYRTSLKEAGEQNKTPDAIAAVRLPDHALAAEGPDAFLTTFVDECTAPLLTLGLLDAAMSLSQRCREFVKKGTKAEGVLLGNQGVILKARGDLDGAIALLKEQERICRQLDNFDGLSNSLGNQATVLQARGDLDGAMVLLKEQERICRRLGNLDGLRASLGNQSLTLQVRGDLDGAMDLLKEDERICRQLGNLHGLSNSLGNQATVFRARGDLDGAMVLLKDQERICRQLGNLDGLQISLGNQALILQDRRDIDGAMALHKDEERICRQLGNLDGLQRSLGNQALILKARGDLDGAMALHMDEERICRQLGNLDGLKASLGHQALILTARGDLDGAMALLKEEERICRQLDNVDSLARSLAGQASALCGMGRMHEALLLAEEAHQLASEHGYAGLAKLIESLLDLIEWQAEVTGDKA